MKILYVSFNYPPEMGAPAARVSELARAWAARGHEVTVLTAFPCFPHGVKRPEDRGVLLRREMDGAVHVIRTWQYATPNRGRVRRTLGFLSYMTSASALGTVVAERPDVIVATSPQIFAGVVGATLATTLRAPFVFEVRDLWPESIVATGALPDGAIVRGVGRMAQWLYGRADRIVTVGAGYRDGILRRYDVPPAKIEVFTNGVDLGRYTVDEAARPGIRAALGFGPEDFVVLYLGAHGMSHALGRVLEAADRLRGRGFRFAFVGDGAEKPQLVALAEQLGVEATFVPPVGKDDVVRWYTAADACLVPLRRAELFTEVLPSKMFEIMAMQRPFVISVAGEARRVAVESGAAIPIEPEDVPALCEALEGLRAAPERARAMGQSGRRFVERRYDRARIADDYLGFLEQVAEEGRAR